MKKGLILLMLSQVSFADSGECLAKNDKLRLIDHLLTSIMNDRNPTEAVTDAYCNQPNFLFHDIQTDLRKYDPQAKKDFKLNNSLRPALHRLILSQTLSTGYAHYTPFEFCELVQSYEKQVFERSCFVAKDDFRKEIMGFDYINASYEDACKFMVAEFNKNDICRELPEPKKEETSSEPAPVFTDDRPRPVSKSANATAQ